VKQLARKSALNARAREGALHVVERFAFRRPKTAQLAGLLVSLGLERRKVLVLTAAANEFVFLSGRNLPGVEVMPYGQAAAYDILWSEAVVVEEGAFTGVVPESLSEEPEEPEVARPRTPKRADASTPKAKPAGKGEARSAAKAAKPSQSRSERTAKPAAKAKTAKKTEAKSAGKKATKPAKPAPSKRQGKAPKKKGSE
jgi:ribosomal L4/L1-like protein